jgi:MraZ protein
MVQLPGDACVPAEDEIEPVKPLPPLQQKVMAPRPKVVLPLTGTYPCNLDNKKNLFLPQALRDQLGECDMVLLSPGHDQCLWLTNKAHLERLAARLEQLPARETEVRDFRRLYFAQTEKVTLTPDGRATLPDRLAQFAGLHQEVVVVGIDDHFEIWDASHWKKYAQQKSGAGQTQMVGHDER